MVCFTSSSSLSRKSSKQLRQHCPHANEIPFPTSFSAVDIQYIIYRITNIFQIELIVMALYAHMHPDSLLFMYSNSVLTLQCNFSLLWIPFTFTERHRWGGEGVLASESPSPGQGKMIVYSYNSTSKSSLGYIDVLLLFSMMLPFIYWVDCYCVLVWWPSSPVADEPVQGRGGEEWGTCKPRTHSGPSAEHLCCSLPPGAGSTVRQNKQFEESSWALGNSFWETFHLFWHFIN